MISIITPVYNGERFIESCIQAVIAQACPNAEHVIMDGGSTDRTVEIVRQYAEKYQHIRWISEKDKGQSDAMNKGIAIANGEVIGILNVDDFYEPNVLNRVSEIFNTLPEPSLLVGNCNVWNNEAELKYINKPKKLRLTDLLLGFSINPHPVNPSAYFYHKSLHEKIGLYDIEEHYVMDVDFLFKAVQAAKVTYIDETWGNYRDIEGTKTFNDMKSGQSYYRRKRIMETHLMGLPLIQRLQLRIIKSVTSFITFCTTSLPIKIKYFSKYPQELPLSFMTKLKSVLSVLMRSEKA